MRINETDTEWLKCRIKVKESDDIDTCIVFVEKLGEKRTVPLTSLRPLNGTQRYHTASRRIDQYVKSIGEEQNIDKCGSKNVKSRIETNEKYNDLVYDYDAICKSLDLGSYINLSKFDFSTKNQQEIIAYPMVYSQSNNIPLISGGQKALKNRQQNAQNSNNLVNDSQEKQQVQMTKIEEENAYTNNIHDLKPEQQQIQNQTGGYYQPLHEQNIDGNNSVNQQQVPGYFHPGGQQVYYCPASEYSDQMYPPEMVMPQGVYVPANAYQPPPIQPNVYGPIHGNHGNHYPVHVGAWPGYSPHMNAQGN